MGHGFENHIERARNSVAFTLRKADPCFSSDASIGDNSGNVGETLNYLQAAIRRTPDNLPLHVRRLLLLIRQPRPDAVLLRGALADLFIALGYHGIDLKLRMLRLVRSYLDPSSLQLFKTHLYSGFRANDPVIGSQRGSILTAGYRGKHQLVETK